MEVFDVKAMTHGERGQNVFYEPKEKEHSRLLKTNGTSMKMSNNSMDLKIRVLWCHGLTEDASVVAKRTHMHRFFQQSKTILEIRDFHTHTQNNKMKQVFEKWWPHAASEFQQQVKKKRWQCSGWRGVGGRASLWARLWGACDTTASSREKTD